MPLAAPFFYNLFGRRPRAMLVISNWALVLCDAITSLYQRHESNVGSFPCTVVQKNVVFKV